KAAVNFPIMSSLRLSGALTWPVACVKPFISSSEKKNDSLFYPCQYVLHIWSTGLRCRLAREEIAEMTVGIRHDDLRRRNRAMIISAVRRARQPSRTEIAGTTGLSHSTISAISA